MKIGEKLDRESYNGRNYFYRRRCNIRRETGISLVGPLEKWGWNMSEAYITLLINMYKNCEITFTDQEINEELNKQISSLNEVGND